MLCPAPASGYLFHSLVGGSALDSFQSLPLLLSALIGLDFARRYSIGEQLRLVWMVLATVMVLGVIAQVFFPGVVPDLDFEPGGAWNGIVVNKNTWARLIVLTGIVFLVVLVPPDGVPWPLQF